MRTTILIGSLLFLAGSALAQDSPITVGDTSSQPVPPIKAFSQPIPPIKAFRGHIPTGQGFHVETDQFQYDGVHFVSVQDYKAACFVMSPGAFTPVSLSAPWTLTLSGSGVTLSSKDGNRIEIDYNQKPIVLHNMATVQRHEVQGFHLVSGTLSNTGSPTKTYTPSGPYKSFVIHYCPKGNCTVAGKDLCK